MEYDYNDYELVYLIREDVEEAVDVMIDKYEPIVRNMAFYYVNNFKKFRIDYEDLLQEGRIGLVQAIRNFNDKKDVLFYSFAVLCIKGKMINYITTNSRLKQIPLCNSCSIDDPLFSRNLGDNFVMEEELDLRELERTIINFKNSLDFSDANIFELKVNGFSYKEISELLGIEKKKIDNKLYIIRKKFKIFLLTC